MAMSFARPDPSSPTAVADARFNTTRRGFDQGEVTDFLRMVAAELGRLQERERFLERELRTAQSNPDLSSVQLDEETLTRLLGEETARVLTTARESAAEIRQKAEQSASQLLSEAADEATRLREEAEIEASRRRSDASADAEAELSMAKQQGREMVNEARAYRERVLSELARRRELAREQIEQLLHGRDRLMQSFERARLVAVDVVAELAPLGEPDEYVNLAPTTGPVPVMLPNTPREVDAPAEESADALEPETIDSETIDSETIHAEMIEPETIDSEMIEPGAVDVETADETVAGDDAEVAEAAAPTEDEAAPETPPTDDADNPEADDTDNATSAAEDADGEHVGEAEDDLASPDVADVDEQDVDDDKDDVVVDLFARLRADTSTSIESEVDEAEPAQDDGDDASDDDAFDSPAAAAAQVVVGDTVPAVDTVPADTVPDDAADAADDVDLAEATPFQQRDADLTPLIVSSARRIKRVLADEQNEALETLRRNEPVGNIDDLLPASDGHRQRYRSAIADDLRAAVDAGAAAAGAKSTLRQTAAGKALAAAEAVLDEWVTVPLRERLERAVADGDGDNASIAKSVRAVYREWKTQHIDEQLDDVMRAAYGNGAFAAIRRGTAVVWVADPDHQVCADCNDNTLAGALAVGDEFPTGHQCAPAHLGCRCLLLPAGH